MDNEIPDIELIRRFAGNDSSAFEILYERYRRQLYSYINRLLPGQHALADDIFQQTWLRIIAQLGTYRHSERFLAWAMRISHNLAVDHFRRAKFEVPTDFQELPNLFQDDSGDFWEAIDSRRLSAAVEDCASKLPPEQREVFICRQNGLSFKEISEIQGCSINTALARMQYALRNIRKCLSRCKER